MIGKDKRSFFEEEKKYFHCHSEEFFRFPTKNIIIWLKRLIFSEIMHKISENKRNLTYKFNYVDV